jgi:hypothetical protein
MNLNRARYIFHHRRIISHWRRMKFIPAPMALAGLGGLSLLLFRRQRK